VVCGCVVGGGAGWWGVASAAVSTGPEQTAQLFRSSPVFIADDSEARGSLDVARLRQDIGSAGHVYVAVLPARSLDGSTRQTAADIGGFLHDDSAVVIVTVGRQLGAAQGPRAPLPPGDASRIAATTQGSTPDLQAALDTTITEIRRDGSSGGAAATNTPAGAGTTKGSGGSGSGGLLGVLAVLIAAGGALLFFRRRKTSRVRQESTGGLRAEVDSLYARLGSDVSTLNAGSDAVTQQALVDASERYTATGSLLADPRATPAVLAQAKRTAIEGIMATRVARQRLGLDLGPDPMPTPPPSAPQVQGSQPITIDGQSYTGYGQSYTGYGQSSPGRVTTSAGGLIRVATSPAAGTPDRSGRPPPSAPSPSAAWATPSAADSAAASAVDSVRTATNATTTAARAAATGVVAVVVATGVVAVVVATGVVVVVATGVVVVAGANHPLRTRNHVWAEEHRYQRLVDTAAGQRWSSPPANRSSQLIVVALL